MSRYSKAHYEDVAHILRLRHDFYQSYEARLASESTAKAFVVLFAADNPLICRLCHVPIKGQGKDVSHADLSEHDFVGFNRERFLAACGLKPDNDNYEQAMADAEGESQENLEAAEEIYDSTMKGDSVEDIATNV